MAGENDTDADGRKTGYEIVYEENYNGADGRTTVSGNDYEENHTDADGRNTEAEIVYEESDTDADGRNTATEIVNTETEIEVELQPFRYMAGGHSYLLEVSASAICKNYRKGEAYFYQRIPRELEPFTPKYLGDISVSIDIVGTKRNFKASIPVQIADKCKIQKVHQEVTGNDRHCRQDTKTNRELKTHLEEWSKRCLSRYQKSAGVWENKQLKKFLVLENLVCDYNRPSILDVKLGKCPRTDKTAEDTLPRQNCCNDLKHGLNFRIDGYKKFNKATGNYTVLNKATARCFGVSKVVKEICNFFHDGTKLRVDAIYKVIDKLDTLHKVFSPEKEWSFNAASLLLMYDISEKASQNSNNTYGQDLVKSSIVSATCEEYINPIQSKSSNTSVPLKAAVERNRIADPDCFRSCLIDNNIGNYSSLNGGMDNFIKADVKLVDFQKTDICKKMVDENDNTVQGIVMDILKLTEILSDLLCKESN